MKQGYRIRIVTILKDASASDRNQPTALASPPTPKSKNGGRTAKKILKRFPTSRVHKEKLDF